MPAVKKWSKKVTETSDAMDVRDGTFKQRSAAKIAREVESDAKKSTRKKSSDYAAAISMLTFYINRAGKNLTAAQRKTLEQAKDINREDYGRAEPAKPAKTAVRKTAATKKAPVSKKSSASPKKSATVKKSAEAAKA